MNYQKPSWWISFTFVIAVATGILTPLNEAVAQDRAAAAAQASSNREKIMRKLKSIVIDKVDFDKADVATVLEFISKKSKELDPTREGINFVLHLPDATAATPGSKVSPVHREVSIVLNNVPLINLLGFINDQTNLQYSVEEYAVYVHPEGDPEQNLAVRTFYIPPGFFKKTTPADTPPPDSK